jgi:acetyl-CoA carboxylase carboxyltransferase component
LHYSEYMNSTYEIITLPKSEATFLGGITDLLDENANIEFYVLENTEKVTRKVFDGFVTYISVVQGKRVGICFNDFRSFGSSAGQKNSHRVCEFIDYVGEQSIPLIYLANSIGVRIQDGRKVFKNSFSIIPKIKAFSEKNLYITASLGHTLGLAAVLYSLGHYRFALDGKCKFNLTGPEVFKMFFGNNVSFEEICNEKVLMYKTLLVQEISQNRKALFTSIKDLLRDDIKELPDSDNNDLKAQMEHIENNSVEVFSQFGKSIEARIVNTKTGKKGLIINPLNKPNMMSVRDLDKYIMALNLFEKMKLPVFALVDTSGGDPRVEENNKNIANKLYQLSCAIIDYPFRKQGIVIGRCFGGSSILTMPEFFGGEKSILIEGAYIGIMGDKIIRGLLSKAPAILNVWEENKKNEQENHQDLIDEGIIEKVINASKMIEHIQNE